MKPKHTADTESSGEQQGRDKQRKNGQRLICMMMDGNAIFVVSMLWDTRNRNTSCTDKTHNVI